MRGDIYLLTARATHTHTTKKKSGCDTKRCEKQKHNIKFN